MNIARNSRPTSCGIYILRKILDRVQNAERYKVGKTDDFQKRMQSTEYKGSELIYFRSSKGYKMAREIETQALSKFCKLYGNPVEGRELFEGNVSEMINIVNHLFDTYDNTSLQDVVAQLEQVDISSIDDEWKVIHPEYRNSNMITNMKKNWTQYGYNSSTNSINKRLAVYLCEFHGFVDSDCIPFMKKVSEQQFRARKFPLMLLEEHVKINGENPSWYTQ